VYISRLVVLNETHTRVEFTGNPGLSSGDRLVVTSGIQCGTNCTDEQLAAVSEKFDFGGSSSSYQIGHQVTATVDANRFTIPIGWTGVVPMFDVPLGRGHWERTSSASTAEELKGTAAKTGLKVCWAYSGGGNYVYQLGTVNFEEPQNLIASLSLSTRERGQMARAIITFTTGNKPEYAAAVNRLQLKLVFSDASRIEPHFTNGVAVTAATGWDEQEIGKATQAACGKLFHELWSTDDAGGFPMPNGCYFRIFNQARELFIVFDKKNALRATKRTR
jgi:hypothetical protein